MTVVRQLSATLGAVLDDHEWLLGEDRLPILFSAGLRIGGFVGGR